MLAAVYCIALLSALSACFAISRFTPTAFDIGSVLALRALAFEDTFEEVKIAEREVADGKLESASIRLQRFIQRHSDVQPTTLYATAVGEACALLVETHMTRGSLGKAEKTAALWTDIMPRNYRAWYVLGKVRKERADFAGAADAMGHAFKLTLCIPEITNSYLGLLADLNQYERIVWVAKQYARSEKVATPTVEVFVGVARSVSQQMVMKLADLPVGHGQYYARYDTRLTRGVDVITIPPEIFEQASSDQDLYVLLKVSNLFDDMEVVSVKLRGVDGNWNQLDQSEYSIGSLHREYSGAVAYSELKTNLMMENVTGCEICVSSPVYALSGDSERIIRRAEANLE